MAKTREIKRRIKAVGNIKRITKTMQMIATARFQAAQKRATAAKPFTTKIAELVGELAAAAAQGGSDSLSHPLLNHPSNKPAKRLLLVITSNRGLCGGYNANILRTANAFIREHGQSNLDIEVVGKKGVGFFRFNEIPLTNTHTSFGDKPEFEEVERLAQAYMDQFVAGKYDSVHVVYMGFESMGRQSPVAMQLLPMKNPAKDTNAAQSKNVPDYEFSPEPQELLNELLPMTVKAALFQAFNEGVVSEQIARMIAMKAATDAASKMGKELTRIYNRARQAAITTELSEIIAGTAALD